MLNKEINQLTELLRPHFTGNRSRIECMAAIILGLISAGSANLAEVTTFVQGKLLHDSMYKRIQGFFTEFELCLDQVAAFIMLILPLNGDYRLVFDRTNWKFGKANINYFVLAICYRQVSIPICWINLDKRGCSSDEEKIILLNKFKKAFGFECVSDLLGDREFIGEKLLAYLHNNNVPYTLRIKCDHIIINGKGKKVRADSLFKDLAINEMTVLENISLLGVVCNISAVRDRKKGLIIIATKHSPHQAVKRYEDREQIERMFSALKTRGFKLESTHIVDPNKLERLVGVIAIAFCWAYKMGDHIDDHKAIPRKKHGRRIRSIFKTGFIYLRNLFANIGARSYEFTNVLALSFEKDATAKPFINMGYT